MHGHWSGIQPEPEPRAHLHDIHFKNLDNPGLRPTTVAHFLRFMGHLQQGRCFAAALRIKEILQLRKCSWTTDHAKQPQRGALSKTQHIPK